MTSLECYRLKQDLAAYTSGLARNIRDNQDSRSLADAVLHLAKFLHWHGPTIDRHARPFAAAQCLPSLPSVCDLTSELMAAALEQLEICHEPPPMSAHERIARLAMEVENLRAALANRKREAA